MVDEGAAEVELSDLVRRVALVNNPAIYAGRRRCAREGVMSRPSEV